MVLVSPHDLAVVRMWTGANLAEIREIAPAAQSRPLPHGSILTVHADGGRRHLPPGSLVYLEGGRVRCYPAVYLDRCLAGLLAGESA